MNERGEWNGEAQRKIRLALGAAVDALAPLRIYLEALERDDVATESREEVRENEEVARLLDAAEANARDFRDIVHGLYKDLYAEDFDLSLGMDERGNDDENEEEGKDQF